MRISSLIDFLLNLIKYIPPSMPRTERTLCMCATYVSFTALHCTVHTCTCVQYIIQYTCYGADEYTFFFSSKCHLLIPLYYFLRLQLTCIVTNISYILQLAKTELQQCDSILVSSKSTSTSCQPPLATELHLGLIKSPDYPMTSKLDKAIKKHFSETRLGGKTPTVNPSIPLKS